MIGSLSPSSAKTTGALETEGLTFKTLSELGFLSGELSLLTKGFRPAVLAVVGTVVFPVTSLSLAAEPALVTRGGAGADSVCILFLLDDLVVVRALLAMTMPLFRYLEWQRCKH